MANQLTSGLLAAGAMALVNAAVGLEPISWSIFAAGITSIILRIDSGDGRVADGSPLCHSLVTGLISIYLGATIGLGGMAFLGWDFAFATLLTTGVGVGAFASLISELATGRTIFTIPGNLQPLSWFYKIEEKSTGFWSAWGRFRLKGRPLGDIHINAMSIALVLASISLQ